MLKHPLPSTLDIIILVKTKFEHCLNLRVFACLLLAVSYTIMNKSRNEKLITQHK